MSAEDKVLIVGAGIAGLALAQMLRKQNIPVQVFERDDPEHVRKQGWAVLLLECLAGLEELLPADLGKLRETSVNHSVDDEDSMAFFRIDTMETFAVTGGVPHGQPGYTLRADRELLRKFLWKNLDIVGAKNFDYFEEDANGVTAYFTDGTSFRGSMLVGADGAHSHVRRHLLHQEPKISSYINIMGEGEVPPEIFDPVRAQGTAGIIGVAESTRYMIGQRSIKSDLSSADYYWLVSHQSDTPEAELKWADHATKQELYELATERASIIPHELTAVIRHLGVDGIIQPPLKFVEFVPPDALPQGRVTLIGDALHTMIPFRGAGANTALLDSCDLGRLLIHHCNNGLISAPSDVFKEFEAIAVPRGQQIVQSSHAAGQTVKDAVQDNRVGRNMLTSGTEKLVLGK